LYNGYDKTNALIDSGYSKNYAVYGKGFKLFENVLVKEAIGKLQLVSKANTAYTIEKGRENLTEIKALALDKHDLSTALAAEVALIRTIGDSQITSTPRYYKTAKIDDNLAAEARRIAELRLKAG